MLFRVWGIKEKYMLCCFFNLDVCHGFCDLLLRPERERDRERDRERQRERERCPA